MFPDSNLLLNMRWGEGCKCWLFLQDWSILNTCHIRIAGTLLYYVQKANASQFKCSVVFFSQPQSYVALQVFCCFSQVTYTAAFHLHYNRTRHITMKSSSSNTAYCKLLISMNIPDVALHMVLDIWLHVYMTICKLHMDS